MHICGMTALTTPSKVAQSTKMAHHAEQVQRATDPDQSIILVVVCCAVAATMQGCNDQWHLEVSTTGIYWHLCTQDQQP